MNIVRIVGAVLVLDVLALVLALAPVPVLVLLVLVPVGAASFRWLVLVLLVDAALFSLLEVLVLKVILNLALKGINISIL